MGVLNCTAHWRMLWSEKWDFRLGIKLRGQFKNRGPGLEVRNGDSRLGAREGGSQGRFEAHHQR